MILISREAIRRIARHGLHVYPLEAFGFLLGKTRPKRVHAALPVSKTAHWNRYEDRWNGLAEKRSVAAEVAAMFRLRVLGVYATPYECTNGDYPIPAEYEGGVVIFYHFFGGEDMGWDCCFYAGRWLDPGQYAQSTGRRLSNAINQKRIHKEWLKRVGPIDYSGASPDDFITPDPFTRWQRAPRRILTPDACVTVTQKLLHILAEKQSPVLVRYAGGSTPGEIRTIIPRSQFTVEGFEPVYLLALDVKKNAERTFRVENLTLES